MAIVDFLKTKWQQFDEWSTRVDQGIKIGVEQHTPTYLFLTKTPAEQFTSARATALAANADVTQKKTALQESLVVARDLHTKAAALAQEAMKSAEADVERLKALAAAHQSDARELSSQIVATPAVSDTPAVSASPVEVPVQN